MLLMVVRNVDDGVNSWVSFYGVYDDPELAMKRMKEKIKDNGNTECKLTEHGGWPAYQSDATLYYLKEVEVNEEIEVF